MDTAHRLSQPLRPIVVATGGRLTDIADAYLMDPAVADQVVVVASLGQPSGDGATMGPPNGDSIPGRTIVVRKFRYVQVNAYYPQKDDIPRGSHRRASRQFIRRLDELQASRYSRLGGRSQSRQRHRGGAPRFATDILRVSETGAGPPADEQMPPLGRNESGRAWLVTRGDNAGATARFWQALKDPATFAH